MSQLIVISAIGTDRTGVVQDISKVILGCGGNIEESRMTTLGSEFAVLMLVSGNWHTLTRLERDLEKLEASRLVDQKYLYEQFVSKEGFYRPVGRTESSIGRIFKLINELNQTVHQLPARGGGGSPQIN